MTSRHVRTHRIGRTAVVSLVSLLVLCATPFANAYSGQQYEKGTKITLAQARKIALKTHPGKINDEELEREAGGSGLRYSFDVKNHGVTREVGIDARTGEVLENKIEGPNPD